MLQLMKRRISAAEGEDGTGHKDLVKTQDCDSGYRVILSVTTP